MIQITKIFHFEMAHAIYGYEGKCKNIHGHSYELHVSVCSATGNRDYIPAPGFVVDFSEIKKIVTKTVIEKFDHKLLLSETFLSVNPSLNTQENLVSWQMEPTVENMLVFMMKTISASFPSSLKLSALKLYETKNSYAEWTNDNIFMKQPAL
jgi:6-pyruvoyltetrahydropterin/6-carboxytetrahydropterin synthase